MKKILGILALILCISFFTGCKPLDNLGEGIKTTTTTSITGKIKIIDVTYEGHTHEYVIITRGVNDGVEGIAHWEDCKYCKEHKNN